MEWNNIKITLFSGLWFPAWLFTTGLVGLKGWQIVWAFFIWTYYLGKFIGGLI